jgi:uncharacterized protein YcnI
MKKIIIAIVIASVLGIASPVLAHVVVTPNSAETAAFQTFTVGVPSEKQVPTVAVRLTIPNGLLYVTPTVKPGWKITTKKSGDKVTEIMWSGGSIPVGQRDDFSFSAQLPEEAGTIAWKAYQTYSDGTTVSWDKDPETVDQTGTPYSVTAINDIETQLAQSQSKGGKTTSGITKTGSTSGTALTLSIVALVFSITAIGLARKSGKKI